MLSRSENDNDYGGMEEAVYNCLVLMYPADARRRARPRYTFPLLGRRVGDKERRPSRGHEDGSVRGVQGMGLRQDAHLLLRARTAAIRNYMAERTPVKLCFAPRSNEGKIINKYLRRYCNNSILAICAVLLLLLLLILILITNVSFFSKRNMCNNM